MSDRAGVVPGRNGERDPWREKKSAKGEEDRGSGEPRGLDAAETRASSTCIAGSRGVQVHRGANHSRQPANNVLVVTRDLIHYRSRYLYLPGLQRISGICPWGRGGWGGGTRRQRGDGLGKKCVHVEAEWEGLAPRHPSHRSSIIYFRVFSSFRILCFCEGSRIV